jgi:hypothetical protein
MSVVSHNYSQGKFDPKHPVITQSFLNMFSRCAYSAYRRYVLGEIVPPGVAALQGTSTDAAVTHGCQSVISTGKDAPLKEKEEIAADTFEKKKFDHRLFPDDKLDALKDQTIELVRLHHVVVAPKLRPVATQESIVVSGEKYDLAGTIDLVEKDHILVDTKTSRLRYSENAVKENIQPALYSKLYEAKYGVKPNGFRYDVLVKAKSPIAQQVRGKITETEMGILDHQIESTVQELNMSLETGLFRLAEAGHWMCQEKWCGYLNNGCPKGKRS